MSSLSEARAAGNSLYEELGRIYEGAVQAIGIVGEPEARALAVYWRTAVAIDAPTTWQGVPLVHKIAGSLTR